MRRKYCEFWQVKLKGDQKDDIGACEVEKEDDPVQIEFPDVLVDKIAGITDGFSFAYMQEAFVSTLLIIAGRAQGDDASNGTLPPTLEADVEDVREGFEVIDLGNTKQVHDRGEKEENDPLNKYELWKEIKVQVALLKKEIGKDGVSTMASV